MKCLFSYMGGQKLCQQFFITEARQSCPHFYFSCRTLLNNEVLGLCLGNHADQRIINNSNNHRVCCASTIWEPLIRPLLSDCTKWVFLNQRLKNFTLCSMSPATKIIKLTCSAAVESALGAGNKWMWTDTVIVILASTLCGTSA